MSAVEKPKHRRVRPIYRPDGPPGPPQLPEGGIRSMDGLVINGEDAGAARRAESRARNTARLAQESLAAVGKHQGRHVPG